MHASHIAKVRRLASRQPNLTRAIAIAFTAGSPAAAAALPRCLIPALGELEEGLQNKTAEIGANIDRLEQADTPLFKLELAQQSTSGLTAAPALLELWQVLRREVTNTGLFWRVITRPNAHRRRYCT